MRPWRASFLDPPGHIPTVGESFDWGGWRLEVIDLDGRRIDKVLAARKPVAAEGEPSAPPEGA